MDQDDLKYTCHVILITTMTFIVLISHSVTYIVLVVHKLSVVVVVVDRKVVSSFCLHRSL